jgi:HPt (histidine-containing phosphotransfer) domain-containing protein
MAKTWVQLIVERESQLGVDTVARMAKIFVDDSKTQLQAIDRAIADQNLATARGAAHDLVANAGALCFVLLRQVAEDVEQACVRNDHANVPTLAKGLAPLVDICVVQLRDRYKLT